MFHNVFMGDFHQINLICDCKHVRGHCPKTLSIIRLYCGARVEILDILIRVDSHQNVGNVGVDLVFSISEVKQMRIH